MKTMKKLLSVIIVLALAVTLVPATGQAAKSNSKKKFTLALGGVLRLRINNLEKGKKVTWSSNNKSVATVSKKGRVIAKKVGKAKLTAKVDKKKYFCCTVIVKNFMNTAGKNKKDVAALKKIIVKQRNRGADINGNLNSKEYEWNADGRLVFISWQENNLSGKISFAGLTALEELYCYQNKLTSLNVTKNVTLRKLSCGENKLTSLNVTKNVKLRKLYCNKNQLTSLNVTKNEALKELQCECNELTSLNVTKNVALKELWCGSNELTSLDVTKNVALEWLMCDGNQLTSLDVTKNVALEWLMCDGNQLTSLDVTKNVALKRLKCDGNQITSLDISNNKKLSIWDLDYDRDKVNVIR